MADFGRRIERIRRRFRIPRVIQDRINPLEYLARAEVRVRYRFHPESIMILLGSIFNSLDTPTNRSSPLPPLISLLVTLMFYASGAHFVVIGDIHGVSKASVCRAIKKVTAAICELRHDHVKFPTNLERQTIKTEFYNIASKWKCCDTIGRLCFQCKQIVNNMTFTETCSKYRTLFK